MDKLRDFFKYNFCELKKIYYVNSFIIQDARSICALLLGKRYKKSIDNAYIIPTTFCNANCTFCANRYLEDKRETIPIETFKKAVDEYKKLGKTQISLTPTIGEVFMDPSSFEKINYIYEKGLDCVFYTNAFLLDKNIDNLLNSGIRKILIDIGDIIPKYDARVFQVSENLSKKKIASIIELIKKNKKIDIILDFRPMRRFSEILKDIKKTPLWEYYRKGLFKMCYNTAYDNWGGLISKKDMLGFQVMKRAPKIKKYPCERLSNFSVLPNGDVRVCACRTLRTFRDELVIGNIKNNSIKEMFDSERYDGIIKRWQAGTLPGVCKNCTFYRPKI